MAAVLVLPASAGASYIVYRCGNPANLCRIHPDGTGRQQLTSDGTSDNPYEGAALDPAGDHMAFIHGFNMYASDASAQNAVGPLDTYAVAPPQISFDGSMAVDRRYYPSLNTYYICTFFTAQQSDGTYGSRCAGLGRFPAFTPDGNLVASQLLNGHDVVCLIDFQSRDCTRDIAVDPNADLDEAVVSPDGQTLAVVAITAGTTGSIRLYNMGTGQLEKTLTSGPNDESPAWSPDGTRLAFVRSGNIYTIPANGSPGDEKLLVSGGDTPTWGGPADTNGGTGGTGGTGGNAGPPAITATPPSRLKLSKLTAHGLSITVSVNQPSAVGVELALDAATAKRLGLGHKQIDLGQVTGTINRSQTFTIKIKARYLRALHNAKHLTIYVIVVAENSSRQHSQKVYAVSVSR